MSGFNPASNNFDDAQGRPEHHIHRDSEALPAPGSKESNTGYAQGGIQQPFQTDTFGAGQPFGGAGREGLGGMGGERSAAQAARAFDENHDMQRNAAIDVQGQNAYTHTLNTEDTSSFPENKDIRERQRESGGGRHDAFHEDRPLGTQPTKQGGVSVGGRDDLPEGKVGFGDKLVGKTEKLVGKMTKNPEMHERGELRETGGKAAAHGDARAAHD